MTNRNIFVACDVSSQEEILNLLELIHEDISGIKIGLQYITQRSPEEIRELSKFNKPIFYDGKFFDIKNTLVESIKSLKDLNIKYATVHLLNGLDALKLIFKAYIELDTMKEGDEIIVPANTYIASVLAISDNGLVPVFVEPCIETYNIDTSKIEEKIFNKLGFRIVVNEVTHPF